MRLYPNRRHPKLADHLLKQRTNEQETEKTLERIWIEVVYYDIQGRKYQLSKDEREISPVEPDGQSESAAAQ